MGALLLRFPNRAQVRVCVYIIDIYVYITYVYTYIRIAFNFDSLLYDKHDC
jgi:hypothetical protein